MMQKSFFVALMISLVVSTSVLAGDVTYGIYYNSTKEPVPTPIRTVVGNCPVESPKSATFSDLQVLFLWANENKSFDTFARMNGISKIHRIERATSTILGLFRQDTYTVFGE